MAVTEADTAPSAGADDGHWDDVADVIVVGFGGAGACAAIEAHENGAKVIIADRFEGGGASGRSGGVVYAGGTRVQRDAGVEDSAEEMYKYLVRELPGPVSEEIVQRYCEQASDNVDWLLKQGVPYKGTPYLKKTDYPPSGKFLYFSGNEKRADHAAASKPAPRGHRAVGEGFTGQFYFAALRSAVERLGITVITNAPATRLIQDDSGAVIGVELLKLPEDVRTRRKKLYDMIQPMPFLMKKAAFAIEELRQSEREQGKPYRIRATGGVILSTGGFAHNLDMVRKYAPVLAEHSDNVIRNGSLGCDGSGILLGESVGGDTGCMSNMMISRGMAPDCAREGIFVNARGERFVTEDAYNGDLGGAIANQPDAKCWLVSDNRNYWRTLRDCVFAPRGMFYYFHLPALVRMLVATRMSWSLSGLARKHGWDSDALQASVDENNAMARGDIPNHYLKGKDCLRAIGKGPYFSVNYSLEHKLSFSVFFTLGGLKVAEDSGGVLDKAGQMIPGLYGAGRTAVGLCSKAYISGMSLGDGMFSGRRAGRHAAERAKN